MAAQFYQMLFTMGLGPYHGGGGDIKCNLIFSSASRDSNKLFKEVLYNRKGIVSHKVDA